MLQTQRHKLEVYATTQRHKLKVYATTQRHKLKVYATNPAAQNTLTQIFAKNWTHRDAILV